MPIAITVPRLGWTMDEGVFAGWLKADGDPVRAGESLNKRALSTMFKQIIANNRAGGWRKLKAP